MKIIYATCALFALVATSGCAPQSDLDSMETEIEIASVNSPEGGDFSSTIEAGEADPSVLEISVKYPQLNQRVQVLLENDEGVEEQIYFVHVTRAELTSSGDYPDGPSFSEVFQLMPGSNSVQILINGKLYFGPIVFEVAQPEPEPEPEPEPVKANSSNSSSGRRACTDAEKESARQVSVYGYMAWAGNEVGEFDRVTDFVNRMNQGLATSNSATLSGLLRDSVAWVDGGLQYDTLLVLQSRGSVIFNTGMC